MIAWPAVQARLGVPADGVPGPATFAAILKACGATTLAVPLGNACARWLPALGITANAMELAHWLGQNGTESGGFRQLEENLNYTSAARIAAVWPSRFPTVAAATPYVRRPEALAEKVYGQRMGNREPGWGWRYRGRGIKMVTGRDNYQWLEGITGVELTDKPDAAAEPDTAVRLSALFWQKRGCRQLAMNDDLPGLTRRINNGLTGIEDRRQRTQAAKRLLGIG